MYLRHLCSWYMTFLPRLLLDWDFPKSQSMTCVCSPFRALYVLTTPLCVVHDVECSLLRLTFTPDPCQSDEVNPKVCKDFGMGTRV
ncbi:hypothetical protein T265_01922 [Opisthorchis viverrini]|uniref:Uncharacterized protein n=1 Tax=Opisthorchis viverrini TaxID=6198 RepID=A0A075AIP5_OPIVI|nr:hypothetical protein T265_01922 [Opisthorchis viverrini]KER31994.1 hypothetical protein T265_01922 [Opisthorchis viverrini]